MNFRGDADDQVCSNFESQCKILIYIQADPCVSTTRSAEPPVGTGRDPGTGALDAVPPPGGNEQGVTHVDCDFLCILPEDI